MLYKGKNLSAESAVTFLTDSCIVQRKENTDGIRIDVILKDSGEYVAGIKGDMSIDYSRFLKNEYMSFYITGLETKEKYTRKGIATFLLKEIIAYAEKFNVTHIYVNPIATQSIISQSTLERFYHKFYHSYKFWGVLHQRRIRFYNE